MSPNNSHREATLRTECERIVGLADTLSQEEAAQAIAMCEQALAIAQTLNDIPLQANCLKILGKSLEKTLRYDDAFHAYTQSLDRYTECNDVHNMGLLSMHIGVLFITQGEYSRAYSFFENAYELFSKNNDIKRASHQLSMMAECDLKMTNLDAALRRFFEALELQESFDDTHGITNTLNGIGNVYFTLKNFDLSLQYHMQAFELKKQILPPGHPSILGSLANVSVLYFIRQEYDIALEYQLHLCRYYSQGSSSKEYARTLSNLGRTYQRLQRIDEALQVEFEALEISRLIGNKGLIVTILINIARIYGEQGNHEDCREYLDEAEHIAKEIHARDWELECLDIRWRSYEACHEYEQAFHTFKKHAALQTELIGKEKEKELEQLRLRHELHKAQAEKAQIQQKLTLAEHKSLRAQINPHFFFNSLSSIQFFLAQNDRDSANRYLTKFAKLMRMILDNSRFSTVTLADEIEYLHCYVDIEKMRLNNSFHFTVHIHPSLNADTIDVPAMIFQPFLENAIWHGIMAEQTDPLITMVFTQRDDVLRCEITDNGRGIDADVDHTKNKAQKHRSAGIDIIRERLDLLSKSTGQTLTLTIQDRKHTHDTEHGTRVVIELPLQLEIDEYNQ